MSSVSVIIPTYNALPLLNEHLPDVIRALRPHDELILVDDASSDGSTDWLVKTFGLKQSPLTLLMKTQHGIVSLSDKDVLCYIGIQKDTEIKVLVNQSNQRFASSCNRGVASAKCDTI